jgi:hypothetical protein
MPDDSTQSPTSQSPTPPKTNVQPDVKPDQKAGRAPRIVVDEMRDKVVSLRTGTVIFRPGQVLDNDHMIRLAEDNGVLTRKR